MYFYQHDMISSNVIFVIKNHKELFRNDHLHHLLKQHFHPPKKKKNVSCGKKTMTTNQYIIIITRMILSLALPLENPPESPQPPTPYCIITVHKHCPPKKKLLKN